MSTGSAAATSPAGMCRRCGLVGSSELWVQVDGPGPMRQGVAVTSTPNGDAPAAVDSPAPPAPDAASGYRLGALLALLAALGFSMKAIFVKLAYVHHVGPT